MYNRKPMEKKKKEGMASNNQDMSFKNIMKDVKFFASTHMTWKDKKALENKQVTELGGKPQKKQRLPLSVALVPMKKQKEREEKMLDQNRILGRFGGQFGSVSTRKPVEKKRTPEERVLKSTVGHFKGGVLDVRHLLHPGNSLTNDRDFKIKKHSKRENMGGGGGEGGGIKSKGKKKNGKKKNKGKKKGGGKKRGKPSR
ncbi:PREDICTED: uncharacterized protein LOC104783036 [Camelina sativa]|uniref:Uncharacterized protein LOC104783036 n=1 Tax=Camelina sativa TaxID=90675 RepID=A0ABM0YVC6_CAMSA|nr:PREDICTED: uncharacterized protein LOC104783036 [Camelina sativa]